MLVTCAARHVTYNFSSRGAAEGRNVAISEILSQVFHPKRENFSPLGAPHPKQFLLIVVQLTKTQVGKEEL